MNARKFLNVRVGLTATALALSGAMVLSASCAGDGGGSGGSSNGGNTSNGGSTGNGGSTSNGGSTTPTGGSVTPSGNSVTFSNGQAQGAMTGWAWIALGSLDTATDPVCDNSAGGGSASTPITKAVSCTTTTKWNAADKLCIVGSIPVLPASPVQSDYDNNWGLQIGVNSSDPEGTPLTKFSSTISLTFSGSPATGLRGEIHKKGDPAGTTYCYDGIKSGVAVKMTDFNTECWSGTSCTTTTCKQLTASDLTGTGIDKVGIQVSSTTSAAISVNLCLSGIAFGS